MIRIDQQTTIASYATSIGGVLGSLSFERWMALSYLAIALATFFVNAYYKHKNLEKDKEEKK
ncbi:HP1 family phage holin [Kiloniella sp. b19]|uniref:HP1 family phage holin n=1 Tax=Kiloniella sp. GXU_MW_B19 TaxID=3141326 RepID=UPI0031D028EC